MKKAWPSKPLVELCEVFADGDWIESKDQSPRGIRLIQTGNIGEGVFKPRGEKARYVSSETFKRLRCTEIFEGDCLISRLPDPVGRSCILPETGERMITAVDCTIVRFKPALMMSEFFNYYSRSGEFLYSVESQTTGTTRKRISRSRLGQVAVPVPLLADQKRIVGALDRALGAVATAVENAEKNLQNAGEIFTSALESVFTRRGDGWIEGRLETLTTKIGSGATPRGGKGAYKAHGLSLIRSLNVYDMGFRDANLALIDDEQAQKLSNVTVQRNDVLLNITGASIARCCVVPDYVLPARVNQHVSLLRPIPAVLDADFLHYLLISRPYKDRLLRTGEDGGSTRQAITKAQLETFEVTHPATLKEQRAVVGKLNALAAETNRLESIYRQKLKALDALELSLLHGAFVTEA